MKSLFPSLLGALLLCAVKVSAHIPTRLSLDTQKIEHKLDGALNEWPESSFSKDNETGIYYAFDNDKENFYVALKQQDQRSQIKIMRNGMSLFIDVKGKHKENTGVEFPLKEDNSGSMSSSQNREGGRPDMQSMKQMYAKNMFALRLIGMGNNDDAKQSLSLTDNVNIEFSWDEKEALVIEYTIPIKLFSTEATLKGKSVSVGLKVNGMEAPTSSATPTSTNSQIVGVPSSGGGSRGGGGGSRTTTSSSNNMSQQSTRSTDSFSKEQNCWGKYEFKF